MRLVHTGADGWLKQSRWLAAPAAAAVALRVALLLVAYGLTGTGVITQGDTSSYLIPGRNLLLHGQFASGGLPEIDRTPGYPLFLMLAGMLHGNVLAAVAAQIAVSVVCMILIARIAGRIFRDRKTGAIAAWLYALEPIAILSTVRLMPETLFTLLLLGMIDRLTVFFAKARLADAAWAGVFLAAATFVRPVSYYLAIPLALGLAITAPRGLRWKAPAVLLLSCVPWLASWQIRNEVETGYGGFSSIVEKNLYFYQSAEVTAELEGISLGAEQNKLGYLDDAGYLSMHPEQMSWTQAQRLRSMRAQAVAILTADRGLYLKTHIAGVGVVAFTPCATELLQLLAVYPKGGAMPRRLWNEGVVGSILRVIRTYPLVATTMAVMELMLLFYYAAALVGLLRGRGARLPVALLVGLALYFLVIAGGAQAVGRYRVPVMPEIYILAAGGVVSMRREGGRSEYSLRRL